MIAAVFHSVKGSKAFYELRYAFDLGFLVMVIRDFNLQRMNHLKQQYVTFAGGLFPFTLSLLCSRQSEPYRVSLCAVFA